MVAAEGAAVRVGEADDRRPRRRPSVLGTVPAAALVRQPAASQGYKAPPAPGPLRLNNATTRPSWWSLRV